ncbi:DUF5719 family protein [Microbacterium thalassium]|uniref:Large extracellular alpha-helical protein n=1 Tax=Microbacterium thalassium TaxID=362649 RepID=A0A7X0FPI6_9MICO|nr:DUF5719 family protein [Microbacterium thalassium]MBB6391325.1 hypothetical protein [Microbacterium thalassium]GLK23378.1 hypothetical protein GCM10017607_06960 [Microbacterium thalassium]
MSESRRFRWAATSARMLAGTLVSAIAVVAAVTAVNVPWPTHDREPVSVSAVPAPEASVLACTGGLMTIGRDATDALGIGAATRQAVVWGVRDGAPEPEESRLTPVATAVGEGPLALVAAPQGGERTDLAAAGSSMVDAEDIAGFAASACRPPLLDSWLVGGAATTGAADLVVLANPGTVAATVQLTVYGAAGPTVPAGGERIVVAPGTQQVVPLAGLALGEESPVVRVTSSGAPVQASLQASVTRVLEPIGADQVGPIAEPAAVQVIAGVRVDEAAGSANDIRTLVRLLAPSTDSTATVTVTAVGESAAALEITSVPLAAGVPTEVGLDGLARGLYTVRVDAEAPVVAGAWQTTGFAAGDDFAWYASSPAVESAGLFAVPAGASATLVLVNPAGEPVEVAVTAVRRSSTRTVSVPAGGTAAVTLRSRTIYEIDPGSAPVLAGVSMSGDGALAGYPVWPSDAAAPAITVYP